MNFKELTEKLNQIDAITVKVSCEAQVGLPVCYAKGAVQYKNNTILYVETKWDQEWIGSSQEVLDKLSEVAISEENLLDVIIGIVKG